MMDKSSLLGTAINKSLEGLSEGLGMTRFSVNNGLRQLLPEIWTGLKLKGNQRNTIMKGYETSNNYMMNVKYSDSSLLKGWSHRVDLALKKAQLRVKDVLIIY